MPTIDIIIPNYQYGRFLRDCALSALGQDHEDLRVLIIDNASTDNSVEVARQIAAEDKRVEVITRQQNLGHLASINDGIDWASSEYFMLLCSDDMLAPGALTRALSIMERHPDIGLARGAETQYWSGQPRPVIDQHHNDVQWQILEGRDYIEERCRIPAHYSSTCMLVRTTIQKQAGHYRATLPFACDLEMLLRLSQLGRVARTDAIQGIRREHDSNMSKPIWNERWRDLPQREAAFESFFTKEGSSMPDAERLLRVARRSLGEWAYWSALSHLCRGHFRTGLNLARFSIKRRPDVALIPPVGWLFRMGRPFRRVMEVLREAFGGQLQTK